MSFLLALLALHADLTYPASPFNHSIPDGHVDSASVCKFFELSLLVCTIRSFVYLQRLTRILLGTTKTSVIRKMVSTELVGAGLVGFWIIENDRWLWASAPSHAYGLAGFIIVDLALAFAVARGTSWDSLGVSAAALIQVVAMLGDLENGQPIAVSSTAFRGYLLGDGSFLALLAIQSAILFTSIEMGLVRFLHQHPRWITILHRK